MNRIIASLLLAVLVLGLSCAPPPEGKHSPSVAETWPATLPATRPAAATRPTTRPAPFAQVSAAWLRTPVYTLADMAKCWPYFQHEPFDQAGFCHLSLPFRYQAPDGNGDANEAMAFTFLLSNALDWTPGCYCTRHAYFICKRSAPQMQALAKEYSPGQIVPLMREWQSNLAVGGVLSKTEAGYTGQLEVYDRLGDLVLKKEYDQPQAYFDLLGDMAADFMRLREFEPSQKLLAELRRVRCKPASLGLLGQAAFGKEKSDEEFALYEDILRNDPGFAEVRFWLSTQRQWSGAERKDYTDQVRLAAKSYLTKGILDMVAASVRDGSEPAQADLLSQYVAQAAEMLGRNHPVVEVLGAWASKKSDKDAPPVEKLQRLKEIAAEYPNDYWLLTWLAHDYSSSYDLLALSDRAMTASMLVAALQNLTIPATTKAYSTGVLAGAVHYLGYGEMAVSAVRWNIKEELRYDRSQVRWNLACVARSWADLGDFTKAINMYRYLYREFPESTPSRADLICEAAIAAAVAQQWNVVDQIARDHAAELAANKIQIILNGYRQLAAGKADPAALYQASKKLNWLEWWWWRRYFTCMMAEVEAKSGTDMAREDAKVLLLDDPGFRPAWIAFDQYDRRAPRKESAAFYETLECLHGGDPWVVRAVADFHKRSPDAKSMPPEELLAKLQAYPPVLYAKTDPAQDEVARQTRADLPLWAVDAAVRQLVRSRQFDRAEELALRYNCMSMNIRRAFGGRAISAYLVHLVRQVRDEARKRPPEIPGLRGEASAAVISR